MRYLLRSSFYYIPLGILLCLCHSMRAQSSDALDQFKSTGSKLKTYALEYKQVSDADPGNKGASILKLQLEDVVTAMEGYLAGTLERDEMAKTAANALVEARKYNTDKAKEVVRLLTSVQSLINDLAPRQPQNNSVEHVATSTEPAEDGGAALQVDPELKRNIEVKDAGTGLLERYIVYLLFGLYLLAVVLLGFVLAGVYKRRVRALKQRMAELEDRLEQMTDRKENGSNYAEIVQKDLMKRWEMLENNTIEFIARVEEQLKDLQKSRALSNKHLEERMTRLEDSLAGGQAGAMDVPIVQATVAPMPEPQPVATAPGKAPHQEACLALSQQLRDLPLMPGVEEMDTLATDLAAAAQRPVLNLNLKPLGEMLQLMWLRAQFDKHSQDSYERMKALAMPLNLRLEDQMAGRMSFSEFYAQNTALSQILPEGEPLFPAQGIPNGDILLRAQTSTATADAVKNTVLLTLLPTVIQLQEGAKTVLARGHYVVYG